ncbi:MFS transporter [Aquincola sp. J276]|uniref:MFS transporter n=1 Tax=Aquincola sp. J276 TaxID=2898432 RepID=UPI003857E4DE
MLVSDGLPPPARTHAMAAIILGLVLAVLDGTIVNLALPGIARDLNATAAQAVWVVNGYQLATLALLLPLATLGDRIGYRRVYFAGVAVFTAASLACLLSGSLWALALARVVQGMGAAGIMSVNTALVRQIYPKAMLGRGVAINSLTVAGASVAGPTVAAAILSVAPWPALFVLNIPLGLLVIFLGYRVLPHNPAPTPEHPAPAAPAPLDVLLNIAMFSLVFLGADLLGARHGAAGGSLAQGLGLLGAGLLLGAFYLRRQWHQPAPLMPIDLLRIPLFRLSIGTSVCAFAAQMLAFIALPFLLLDGLGRSHLAAGLLITAWPLAIVVVAPIAGRLIGRFHNGLLGGIGLALMALGLGLLAALPAVPSDADIVWRMLLCGAGFGLFQSPNNHTIVTSAPPRRSGAASGMLGTARLTGQTLGAVLLAGIFSLLGAQDGRGAVVALTLAAGFAAAAGLLSLLRVRHAG